MKKYYLLFIIATGIALFAMHIPFLLSDPDINISDSGSRDANTDEGQNSCQIRNYVNHNNITLKKSDNLIKTPLFGAILYLPFKFFGTKLLVGRLSVLLLSLGLCFFIFYYNKYLNLFGLCAIIIAFCEFHIFNYFHYCMAEIISTSMIFISVFFMVKPYKKQPYLRSSFLSATFISLAYFVKIQFAYDIIILPLSIILFILFKIKDRKILLKQLLYTIAFLVGYLLIYYLFWYFPNKNFYEYVMEAQTKNRFESFSNLFNRVDFNLQNIFYKNHLFLYTYTFYFLYVVGLVYCFFSKSTLYKLLFIGISGWIFSELHKLSMNYIPSRYIISILFSMGLIMALVLTELITIKGTKKIIVLIKALSILILITFGIKNYISYSSSLRNRTYDLLKINNYLSQFRFENKPIIGAWAPSLTWGCKAISYPVWKDYFNDVDVLKTQDPEIIITEDDEKDSDQAFLSRGISIDEYADSIKNFTISRWQIKLLWINPNKKQIILFRKLQSQFLPLCFLLQ